MPSNVEEKENQPKSESQEIFTMVADHVSEVEMDSDKESNLNASKILKRKIKNDSLDDHAVLAPMAENLNVLNMIESESGEPSAKKKCDPEHRQNLADSCRPFYSIICQDFLISIEAIGQIHTNENEMHQNLQMVKLRPSSKLKRENPEITPVRFLEKNVKLGEEIEQNSHFYIGHQTIKLFNIGPKLANFDFLNEKFKFYVYESIYDLENESTKFGNADPRMVNKVLIEAENRDHFLIISNFDHSNQTNCEEKNFFLKFDKTQLSNTILRLTASNYMSILLDKLECSSDSINLSFNIFLSPNCRNDHLISSDPSFNFSNSKSANDINFVMGHFFASLNSTPSMAAFYQNNNSDKFCERGDHNEYEIKNRNENLFDLIYQLHKENGSLNKMIGCSDDSVIQQLSNLRPTLRPYQIEGIKWMLFKENFSFDRSMVYQSSSELHPLYTKLVNGRNDHVYYHKFYGIVTKEAPLKIRSLPGGILADEMGLGKTVEILSLIMLNVRNDDFEFKFEKCQVDKNKRELNKKSFSCLCGNTPESFQIDSFKRHQQHQNDQSVYQCVACSVWTHVSCVNYRESRQEFLCLECCTKVAPVKSGCTLIVTPSVISYQWADEIRKHVDKKLNVLVYKGTSSGFIQPRDLAKLDICITTYDVLSNELAHVFAIENQRSLRKAKRFSNIPSPLIYVEWWRVCLDEAQMVHSTNSRCAEMANRLHAINRWCVTGTPIGRSLGDLHGLFTFIREDPYINKKWFKYCLFEPFQMGDKMPMAKAVSNVLWRTSKRFVENQIDIPKQTEICYWIDFSPFEAHLYQRVLELFRENRKNSFKGTETNQSSSEITINEDQVIDNYFSKYLQDNMRLDEIERSIIDQILAPVFDLRLACNHPQLILRKRTFMAQGHLTRKKEKLLTMEKSLQILTKKTQIECNNIFRTMTMHSNAIAGLYILQNQLSNAINIYQEILDSEKHHEYNVSLDLIQKVHTYHNYIEIMITNLENKNKNLDKNEVESLQSQIEALKINLNQCEKEYKLSFIEKKSKEEQKFMKSLENVDSKLKNKKYPKQLVNFMEILEAIKTSEQENEFWEHLSKEFSTMNYLDEDINYQTEVKLAYTFCGRTIKTINELELIFTTEFESMISCRDDLLSHLNDFLGEIQSELVSRAADCHLSGNMANLRPNQAKKTQKCKLCQSDQTFKSYAKHLFSNSTDTLKLLSKQEESDDGEDETVMRRTSSDLEKVVKLINWYCKSEKSLASFSEKLKEMLEFYTLLKTEFQHSRQFWVSVFTLVNSMDELEMAKIRLRFSQPGEKNTANLDYIINPSLINYHFMRHEGEKNNNKALLSKKLGQLLYLKHSSKKYTLTENQENTDLCPICQCNLGFEWFILSCGHLFCKDCYNSLLTTENSFYHNLKRCVRCPMCRENCFHEESHLVSTKKMIEMSPESKSSKLCFKSDENEEYLLDKESLILKNVKIKGDSNSAKVESIVKCLVKILCQEKDAKCLVFSEHVTMLDLIIDLLNANSITFCYVKDNGSFQKKIEMFKKDKTISVLLMPYSFGANGLNVIEATHVLLVEPTLNKSQEIQSIGRVHRIGQTKPTFVYRFMVKNSIEEHVYSMFKTNTSYSMNRDDAQPLCSKSLNQAGNQDNSISYLTISDIKKLFLNL
ncbi:E3 ubiquitin- ligase SHPRH [Brachionus plicatilis]|uniref:E3 ubiquitin-ligase SHPRH n=1 Tax=Brachionus plicatilis TaxID=10195 RepID=A0A3M7QRK6_BRAPC|nr:E3 ubiquitin- ligase SHPRH [Brachionus plicatilis]